MKNVLIVFAILAVSYVLAAFLHPSIFTVLVLGGFGIGVWQLVVRMNRAG